MLTIGQLASYAGVTVRTVRHYHQINLLPEPERDASGYRRYSAKAVVSLIKIRTLAEAGVPLSEIDALLHADSQAFGEAVERIDARLADEIAHRENSRKQIAELAAGDHAALPPEVTSYLQRLREIGISESLIQAERDGWILFTARWPAGVRELMPSKLAQLDDPRMVRLYQVLSRIVDGDENDDALMEEAADIMAALAEEAHAAGEVMSDDDLNDELPFDLLDSLAVEADPRAQRIRDLMRQRGWDGWIRQERVAGLPPR
jgi:DNA-binding transcriptional MerR regulator